MSIILPDRKKTQKTKNTAYSFSIYIIPDFQKKSVPDDSCIHNFCRVASAIYCSCSLLHMVPYFLVCLVIFYCVLFTVTEKLFMGMDDNVFPKSGFIFAFRQVSRRYYQSRIMFV